MIQSLIIQARFDGALNSLNLGCFYSNLEEVPTRFKHMY